MKANESVLNSILDENFNTDFFFRLYEQILFHLNDDDKLHYIEIPYDLVSYSKEEVAFELAIRTYKEKMRLRALVKNSLQ